MLTEAQLREMMPRLAASRAAMFLPHLNAAMAAYGIGRRERVAAFIAQLAHESGELRYMEEIWGPTDAQRRYEPVTDLARRLGNDQRGDGARFKGRGPIQITGRANYRRYGDRLGLDLVAAPERAAAPDVAFAIAGLYWSSNGLNELADAGDFVAITRRINGGTNGLADRQRYWALAREVLAITGFVDEPEAPVARGPRTRVEPLERGAEALREAGISAVPRRRPAAAARAG